MRAQGVYALVFKIDVCGCVEYFLQGIGTHQGGRTVKAILVLHLFRNINPCVLNIKLLARTLFTEDVRQVVGVHRFACGRVERWQRFGRHVGLYAKQEVVAKLRPSIVEGLRVAKLTK